MPTLDTRDTPLYRIIAVNLEVRATDHADRVATILREEGWPRSTRSLVIRKALERLLEELDGKSAREIFQFFVDRRAPGTDTRTPDPVALVAPK